MIIRLTKGEGSRDTLTCVRADGSVTQSRFMGQHDLVHYVVETVLGLKNSFYGLVAGGYDISDFNVAGASKALGLPAEAGQTEFIVGLLQTELSDGAEYEDFIEQLATACSARGVPAPDHFSELALAIIRDELRRLMGEWEKLAPGETLELSFDAGESTPTSGES